MLPPLLSRLLSHCYQENDEVSNLEERDARGRDFLGFLEERCPHCGAMLYLADDPAAHPICLNACTLPGWAYRLLLRGLGEAAARVAGGKEQG